VTSTPSWLRKNLSNLFQVAPMTRLNKTVWSNLPHAYGTAEDTPDLLRQLEASPTLARPTMRTSLGTAALCHQGDVYLASYAALPHMARIEATIEGIPHQNYFVLPTCIKIARLTGRGSQTI
jgi:hypothetical protein